MRIAALKQKQPENIAQVSLSSNMPTEKSVMIIYCLIIRKKKRTNSQHRIEIILLQIL